VSLFGSVSLMAEQDAFEWPQLAPELWNENMGPIIKDLALKGLTERGPIEPPPVIPPDKEFRPLGMNPAKIANWNGSPSTPGNLDSSSAQAIPGSRSRSFMSEHRVAERSLRGTIKRLG
jgi:hypothetical protein